MTQKIFLRETILPFRRGFYDYLHEFEAKVQ